MKKILCFAVIAVLCIGMLTACGGSGSGSESGSKLDAAKDLETITKTGKMVIGITDYKPMNYKDDDGKYIGFDTEYTEAVCAKLGIEAEFVEINWDNKEIELNAGNVDALWNGVTYTEERAKTMDFSKPYVKNDIVVVVQKENADKYKTAADLAGIDIVAEKGSTGADAVEHNEELGGKAKLVPVDSLVKSLMEVSFGTADAAAVDSTMAVELVGTGSYENLVILPDFKLSEELLAIAFRKGSDLPAKVDEITQGLVADGTMENLALKYKVAFFYE